MSAQKPGLMLFAAGLGTRMRPLTDNLPKAMVQVDGVPMIDRAIDLALDAGISRIAVNTHYLADTLADHLAGRPVRIFYEPDLLDTGGGLKATLDWLGDPVLTMNSDAVWRGANPLNQLLENWRGDDEGLAMLAARAQSDFAMNNAGKLTRSGPWVYTGAQMLRASPVKAVPDRIFSLNRVWDDLITRNSLRGLAYDGRWCDVGSPDAIDRAERMLSEG